MFKRVVTRFAPSPTGYLHVGGARTALYNYLFAGKNKGEFRLRIENTDRQRSQEEMTKGIFNGLNWLGLVWDDEIIFQDANAELHKKAVLSLLDKKLAYRCFCSTEELKIRRENYKYNRHCMTLSEREIEEALHKKKSFSIRFKVPIGNTAWEDIIHGYISVRNEEIEDFVILRSDESPTYQLAATVDDHYMKISHIIRGDDHISNTPKQIMLYQALDWQVPQFAHIPLILGTDKTPLSKRHGAIAMEEYQKKGILADAMFNYLALLGWSPNENIEILDRNNLIEMFELKRVAKKSAVFDEQKLAWINQQYIIKKKEEDLLKPVTTLWKERGFLKDPVTQKKKAWLIRVLKLLKIRAVYLNDFVELAQYFFEEPINFDTSGIKKYLKNENIWVHLEETYNLLKKLSPFHQEDIENTVRGFAEKVDISAGKLIHPIRLAITGRTATPGLFEIMELIGKETVLNRLRKFLSQKNYFQQIITDERI